MSKLLSNPYFSLQLFGEGGGDGGTGTGADGAGAQSGQTTNPALAQPTGNNKNPLASVKYGKQDEGAPTAGEQVSTDDRNAKFDALIKGEYKDLYESNIQQIIGRRLKSSEEATKKYEQLSPVLDLLANKYGVKDGDIEALSKAIEDDETFYEDEALERGITVEQVKEIRKMQRENEALRNQMKQQQTKENADRLYAAWMEQAEQVKGVYPSFDLAAEMQNEQFRKLLQSNVPVQTAFEVIHKDEIIPAAMQYTAQKISGKVANSIRSGQNRPAEGAMSSRSAVVTKSDVSQLTRADRDEIDRRVARGEKIRF
jgi:hypothetical protein